MDDSAYACQDSQPPAAVAVSRRVHENQKERGTMNASPQSSPTPSQSTPPRPYRPTTASWTYEEAFSRNLGLINPQEQEKLRQSRIAIPGMGGVGGSHLMTLARLGIGKFRIADPDHFDVANFNRQYGAEVDTVGHSKAEVMAERARAVNPDLELNVWTAPLTQFNVDDFLDGVDVVIDGIDFFSFDARRMLFREARNRGIWAVTAGPIGFSAAWLVFDPSGMSFDEYFDFHDDMEPVDQFAAFLIGLTPRGTHFPYLDLSFVDRQSGRGPSAGLACSLCNGVTATEVIKILLGRQPMRPVPCYSQFDAYRYLLRQGRLRWGNRGPLQRLKRSMLRRRMIELGYGQDRS
ncbi:MAG: ThiF family adenylyltransferase [Pirellulaceae bacterium]